MPSSFKSKSKYGSFSQTLQTRGEHNFTGKFTNVLFFWLFQGLINVEKELEKLRKNEESITQSLAKLKKSMDVPNYESKVPTDVQQANADKLKQLQGELLKLEEAKTNLHNVSV